MGIVIPGLRGLSAKDRTPEEQKEIQEINDMVTDSIPGAYSDSIASMQQPLDIDTTYISQNHDMPADTTFSNQFGGMSVDQYLSRLAETVEEQAKKDKAYYDSIDSLRSRTHSGMDVQSKYTDEIQKIAENVSPYYKKFRNTDYLTLTTADWNELAAQYAGMYDAYGEDVANQQLNQSIKDNVAGNQSTLQKAWYAIAGMGADAAGSMISGAGMLYGLANAVTGNYEKNPYLNGFENFMNEVVDNEVTRYGSDIVKYGTVLKLNEARELGIPATEIVNTAEQDQQLLSINTPFELIQQGGFTVASMLTAAGASKVADWAFKGIKKGAMGAVMSTSGDLAKAKNVISTVRKVENFNNRVIVPGIVGSVEGVVEGLETKRNIEESGRDEAYAMQREAVQDAVLEKLKGYTEVRKDNESMPEYYDKNGNRVDIDSLYNSTWAEMQPKLDESLANTEAMAAKAGVGNFLANSVINGFLNATFKAGLQSDRVQDALRKGKLTGWAFANERMNVSGGFGNARVTPGITALGKTWSYIKEPFGEFAEEYLQTQSDALFSGMAENNIHSFIDNKYNGDAKKAIGEATSEDWAAAWTELGKSLVSKESMKAGVYGALSSVVGTPVFGRRTNKLDENGNVVLKKDKLGNVVTDKNGKPIAEKTLFGRGQSADGDKETGWEAFQRWVPWRSGLTANIREVNERMDAAKEQAKVLEEWLNDPKNKDKFDGLAGSLSWSREMGQSAAKGNEFSYRNSKLGKMLNDIFMLQKTEGSELYGSIMDQLSEVATMEKGSDLANQYVQSIKDNVNTQDPNKSDDDIFDELKNNANDILDMMAKVKEESGKLEKLLGNIDDDTKQSLIFGQLSIDDWKKRKEKLDSEIAEIKVSNSRESSTNLTDKQKSLLAKYGSLDNAKKMQESLKGEIEDITKEVGRLLARPEKSRTDNEKKRLAYLKVYHNTLKKELASLKPINEISEDANLTLNEEEIMALDPVSRAQLLRRGKSQLYKKLNDSTGEESQEEAKESLNGITPEQKAVIDNLVNQGMATDKDFLSKVIDDGKLQSSMDNFLKQYNSVLMSPQGLKAYAARAKQQAADQLTRERALELGKIQNYTEFVSALTNALNSGTSHDSSVIGSTLKDNENYKKFIEQGEVIERLIKTVDKTDKFKDMDGNTVDLLAQTAYYLYSEGVDLNDTNAAWDALTATDERGYNKFVSFVDAENQGLDVSQQTRFTSLEEVFQTYKDVLSQAQYDKAQQEKIKKPVEVGKNVKQDNPTPPPTPQKEALKEKNTPKGTKVSVGDAVEFDMDGKVVKGVVNEITENGEVYVKSGNSIYGKRLDNFDEGTLRFQSSPEEKFKGIFGSGNVATSLNTPDVLQKEEHGAPATNPLTQAKQDEKQGEKPTEPQPTVQEMEEAQPTNFVAKARKVLEGHSKIKNHEKGAEIANSIMDNMSSEDLESFESLQVAVERETKKLLAEVDNDDNQMAAYLLKQAVAASNPNNSLNEDSVRKASTNSAQIASVNIDRIRERHKNSPLLPFADRYGMQTYVASDKLDRGRDVFFVSDEELANQVKSSMPNYDSTKDLPIVAVVEDENGEYEIDGKKYQPIAIMPSTGNPYSQGSDRMGDIRKLAETSGRKLVMYNGQPLKTKTYGSRGVKATPADDHTTEVNNTVDLIVDLINSPEERIRAKAQSPQERSKNTWYTRVRDAFMKRLDVSTVNDYKMMSYTQPNNKNGGFQPIYMRVKHIDEYVNPTTGGTLLDAVNSGDNNAIVDFNSRTRGVARKIDKFLKSIPSAQDAGIGTKEEIIGKADDLQRGISDYLASTREGTDFKYIIEPADPKISEANGAATFVLSAESKNGDKIQLATFSKNSTATDVAASIIKNLTTENGDWRRVDGNMLAHWQVDYRDVNKMHNGEEQAKKNIAELIDEGIFDMRATNLLYNDMHVELDSPFKEDNTPRYPYVTNNDNADTTPTNGQPVVGTDQTKTSDGTIVDANSGTVLQGSQKPVTNSAYERAKEIAERIVEDSRAFELTSDEKGYVNTKTGRVYNRVTSMISADENGSRFDESSGYGLPSTNIGNAVDEFVRDFFAGTLKKNADGSFNYPNASQKQWESFIKELENLDNIFKAKGKAKGITIVPKDVRVTGTMQISDDEGKTYNVDVAGTLDLLGYDKEGNFYIFDMKTLHNGNLYDKKDKWSLQTSLYEKFLKDKYGIYVKNRFIIPIKVEYDNPSKVSYTQGEGNQLIADGKPFDKAEPKLLNRGLFPVEYREPKIRWDKLTAEEQAAIQGTTVESGESELASGIADLAANGGTEDGSSMEGNPVEASVLASSTPHIDPITGVATDDDLFGDFFADKIPDIPMENPGNINTPVSGKIPYNSLTQEQKETLAKAGITEEAYNKMDTPEEINQINQCLRLA